MSEFFQSLERQLDKGERIAAATVIANHRPALEHFIQQKDREEQFELAAHYRELLQRHELAPRGAMFDEPECSLRTGRLYVRSRGSFTVQTPVSWLKAAAWMLLVGLVVGLAFVRRAVFRFAEEIDGLQREQMELYQPSLFRARKRQQKLPVRPETRGEDKGGETK